MLLQNLILVRCNLGTTLPKLFGYHFAPISPIDCSEKSVFVIYLVIFAIVRGS